LSETVKKNLSVKPELLLQFEKGFFPKSEMLIEPGEVTVSGPKALVDTMQYVYTRTKVFKKLKDTLKASIELQSVNQLRYSVSEVNIVQVIERYTEASIAIPVEPVNLPDGLTMKVFPGTATINCLVPVSDYEKLQPYMFRAIVDYNSVKDVIDYQAKARVTILRTPDYVIDVKINPKNVDFIIEK
jgi:YbbR domain-containing protein